MLQSFKTILRVLFYGLLLLIGVTFAVSNRERIELTLYPLPYAFSMPVFLFTILVLATGMVLGWLTAQFALFGRGRRQKENGRRITALENELAALRSEQLIKPSPLPARLA